MAKTLLPKCKQCRREGTKLFLKGDRCNSSKCALVKKNFPPGLHGAKGRPKLTSYGMQLRAKQKAKRIYGMLEAQFKLYVQSACQKKGNNTENLLQLLESRADNIVFRSGFAKSRAQARELVSHGHFTKNGHKITIPSIQLKKGDVLEVVEKNKKEKHFDALKPMLEKYDVPQWISMDPDHLKLKYLEYPTVEQVAPIFDLKSIIEFYSR